MSTNGTMQRRPARAPEAPAAAWQSRKIHTIDEGLRAADAVIGAMAWQGFTRPDLLGMRIAVEEAIANAIRHGHRDNPSKTVQVSYQVRPDGVVVEVRDEGPGFNPSAVPEPESDGLGSQPGRGLQLMRRHTNWLRFNSRGNCVTLCRYPAQEVFRAYGAAYREAATAGAW